MSKFHSVVSRRDFMKGLGLAGAGLGAAAATAPAFHDLDELMSAPSLAMQPRPWYVKERDFFDPTEEVDWSIMQRFDRANEAHSMRVSTYYRDVATVNAGLANRDAIDARRVANQEPGFDLKFQALKAGCGGIEELKWGFTGLQNTDDWAETPAERGLPNWNGTPEENSRLLYAALRYYGAFLVGFAEVDSTWRNKLFVTQTTDSVRNFVYTDANPYPPESDQLRYVYEDVDQPYEVTHKGSTGRNAGKRVIPNKPLWLLAISTPADMEATKTAPSTISKSNSSTPDNYHGILQARTFNFLRSLGGWTAFGTGGHQDSESIFGVSSVLTGVSESSRQGTYTITPETGPNHIPFTILTDFPLAPTKPIDAGLYRFCHSCTKCAKICPSQSISHEKEPSFEIPQLDGKPRIFCHAGPKHFWPDMAGCQYYSKGGGNVTSGCWDCYANCTFSEDHAAMIHSFVKGTVATSGIFNGFFASMSETFGFGKYDDPNIWWDMSLPVGGFDSTIAAGKGAYGK